MITPITIVIHLQWQIVFTG